jgi:hypothetical protein
MAQIKILCQKEVHMPKKISDKDFDQVELVMQGFSEPV